MINKYRPQNLDQVIGNELVISSLKKRLERPVHSYLLTGESGCGKTTIARIMAHELGCSDLSRLEINCADKTSVQGIRDLKDSIRNKPIDGSNLCVIFDEAHKLTNEAQQALLKITEDAPSHLFFIFCSTNPETIIPTLKNRLVKYHLAPLSKPQTIQLLTMIWESEEYPKDEEGNWSKIIKGIANKSQGIPREAITLLAKLQTTDLGEAREILMEYDDEIENSPIISLAKVILNKAGWVSYRDAFTDLVKNNPVESVQIVTVNYLKAVLASSDGARAKYLAYCISNLLPLQSGPLSAAWILSRLNEISQYEKE